MAPRRRATSDGARRWQSLFALSAVAVVADGAAPDDQEGGAIAAVPWQPGPTRYDVTVAGADGPTLTIYPPDGPVDVVTGKVLTSRMQDPEDGGKTWYVVEMYDHMCPHCWYAVPILSRVAKAYQAVPNLKVASLNCHVRENREACFFLELIAEAVDFPTFLLCPPSQSAQKTEELLAQLPGRARALVGRLYGDERTMFLSLVRCTRRYLERHLPRGQEDPFLTAPDIATWVTDQSGLKPSSPEDLAGQADLNKLQSQDPGAPPGRPGWLRDDEEGAPGVPAWVPGQRWFDALRGFVHFVHSEYRTTSHFDIVRVTEFMSKAFPVKGMALQSLSERLKASGPQDKPEVVRQLISEWATAFELPDANDPGDDESSVNYLTCQGSTCVMWTLLHITVAAVAVRGVSGQPLLGDGSILAQAKPEEYPTVPECLSFVRVFVSTFLNCKQCKADFLTDFDNCEFGRCAVTNYRDLALWLWRAHNAVSLRVAKLDQAQVDRRWPMYQDCPACWREELTLGSAATRRLRPLNWHKEELDSPYHTDHVFWHIVRTYIGITRVRMEMDSLSPKEQLQVQAVMDRDREQELQAASQRPVQHRGFVEPPPAPVTSARPTLGGASDRGPISIGIAVSFLVLVLALGVILYLNGFFEGDIRSSRQPMLREPPTSAEMHQQDEGEDDELTEERDGKADEPLDTDPAAE